MILPPSHRQFIESLSERISKTQPWKVVLGVGVGTVVLTVLASLAFLLTEILQVHDKWYDKYIIKWRHRYAVDFILPRLVQPFASRLNYRFFEEAEARTRQFQEALFYPFVGDQAKKIPDNKRRRFYEVVTHYWLWQVNEIVLLVLGVLVAVYGFAGPAELSYRTYLLTDYLILSGVFLLNRFAVRRSLSEIRVATADEIRAIHDDPILLAELKTRLGEVCKSYNVPFDEA